MSLFEFPGRALWQKARKGSLLVILLGCFGCSSSSVGEKAVFQMNLSSGNLESMDPAFARDLYVMWMTHMVYNTLVETDDQLRLVPSLARSWEKSPDGRIYWFFLRDSVYFHDSPAFPGGRGRKLVAQDVVYTFERLIDPATASPGAWIFGGRIIEDRPFRALSDSVVEIRLKEPFAPLPGILTMPYTGIVAREVVEYWGRDFRSHPCGTGPFQFHLWEEGNQLILHRHPRYWERDGQGNRLPYLDAVQVHFVTSKATEFFQFLQGKLDFVNNLDPSFKDLILRRDGTLKPGLESKMQWSVRTYLNTEYLGFLMDSQKVMDPHHPVRHRKVRQAINYALDREKIARYFRNGTVVPATGGMIPPGLPGHDSSRTIGYEYQPQKALALLEEAGYPQGRGLSPLEILCPDNYADIVQFIATQLQEIGIDARVSIMQPNILREQMSRSQALCFRAQWIADYPDAETYMVVFQGDLPAPPNYTRFRDPRFDRLYSQALSAPDSLRPILYRRMDSLAMDQAPVVPIYYEQLLHFTSPRVRGFSSSPMNLIELKRVRFTEPEPSDPA